MNGTNVKYKLICVADAFIALIEKRDRGSGFGEHCVATCLTIDEMKCEMLVRGIHLSEVEDPDGVVADDIGETTSYKEQ